MRVHQHGACIAGNSEQLMGRSRGGLTTKIHAVVDTSGLPVRLALTTGEAHDNRLVLTLLSGLKSGAILLADRGFDADWIRTFVSEHGGWANIPPRRNRREPICFSPHLYRARNLVDRFFNKISRLGLSASGGLTPAAVSVAAGRSPHGGTRMLAGAGAVSEGAPGPTEGTTA